MSGPSSKSLATVMLSLFYEYHMREQSFRRHMFLSRKLERSIFYEIFKEPVTVNGLKTDGEVYKVM